MDESLYVVKGNLKNEKGKPVEINPDQLMIALDTTKYPPTKITYTIEGIEEGGSDPDIEVWQDEGEMVYQMLCMPCFSESEIETIFV